VRGRALTATTERPTLSTASAKSLDKAANVLPTSDNFVSIASSSFQCGGSFFRHDQHIVGREMAASADWLGSDPESQLGTKCRQMGTVRQFPEENSRMKLSAWA
jgi:hypothetical protein